DLLEPAPNLFVRADLAARVGRVVDVRVVGEDGVEQGPVLGVDRPSVADDDVMDLGAIRELLRRHEASGLGSAASGLQLIASVNLVVTTGFDVRSSDHVVSVT